MATDRTLLEKCLRELESRAGANETLIAEIRRHLETPPVSAVEMGGPAGEPGAGSVDGANTLWDTNKAPDAD